MVTLVSIERGAGISVSIPIHQRSVSGVMSTLMGHNVLQSSQIYDLRLKPD